MLADKNAQQQGISVDLNELLQLRFPAQSMSLHNRKRVSSQLFGGHLSRLRGRGIEFDEARLYQPGDDIRHMDWRVTARAGKPHTKLFQEERERPVFVVVDYGESMYFGTRTAFKSTIASQAAALIGWAGVHGGDRVGGILFSGDRHVEFRPQARMKAYLPLLNQIAKFSHEQQGEPNRYSFTKTLKRLRSVAKPGSKIFIISDFYSFRDADRKHLGRLAQTCDVVACATFDPLEVEPPLSNVYTITDGKNKLTLDTMNSGLRKAYQEKFEQRYLKLRQDLTLMQIPMIDLFTNQSVQSALGQTLRD